jgi:iron uptake system component EfeO
MTPSPVTRIAFCLALLLLGCSETRGGAEERERAGVERLIKRFIREEIETWLAASRDLAEAAPLPKGRGWDAARDGESLASMKRHWGRARYAYERIEGAMAPMFPESDVATDARYDDFLLTIGPGGDTNAFDDQGVVGTHAVERILWADSAPPEVVKFERGIPGYRPAEFPPTEADARAFKLSLAHRLVSDIEKLRAEFEPLSLDLAFAFRGTIDLAAEQIEKVDRAATGQEESRYAQATMRDLRANREGCLRAYETFRPWLLSKKNGLAVDGGVMTAFARLERAYAEVPGDAIPRPPATWSSVQTTREDLATPFGRLFTTVKRESDESVPGSLKKSLLEVAGVLELPLVVLK